MAATGAVAGCQVAQSSGPRLPGDRHVSRKPAQRRRLLRQEEERRRQRQNLQGQQLQQLQQAAQHYLVQQLVHSRLQLQQQERHSESLQEQLQRQRQQITDQETQIAEQQTHLRAAKPPRRRRCCTCRHYHTRQRCNATYRCRHYVCPACSIWFEGLDCTACTHCADDSIFTQITELQQQRVQLQDNLYMALRCRSILGGLEQPDRRIGSEDWVGGFDRPVG